MRDKQIHRDCRRQTLPRRWKNSRFAPFVDDRVEAKTPQSVIADPQRAHRATTTEHREIAKQHEKKRQGQGLDIAALGEGDVKTSPPKEHDAAGDAEKKQTEIQDAKPAETLCVMPGVADLRFLDDEFREVHSSAAQKNHKSYRRSSFLRSSDFGNRLGSPDRTGHRDRWRLDNRRRASFQPGSG